MDPYLLLFRIFIAVVILVIILTVFAKIKNRQKSQPPAIALPPKSINDKIIIIQGAPYLEVRKAAQQFCELHNPESPAALPYLTQYGTDTTFITFPHDLEFETFCYCVNYLHYAEGISNTADTKAWTTTNPNDTWITEKSANKKVMLFIPADDDEYDNVFLTTEAHIGYKLGFAHGHEAQLLSSPKMKYSEPTVTMDHIKDLPAEAACTP